MNTKTKQAVKALAVGLTVALGAGSANAQTTYTIGGNYTGNSGLFSSTSPSYQLEEGWNLTMDGGNENGVLVGDIQLTQVTGHPIGAVINTVCVDILGTVYLGENYTYIQKTFAQAPSAGIDPIWGYDNAGTTSLNYDHTAANEAIQNAAYIFAQDSSVLTSGTLTQKAALQLAVWTALYDTGAQGNHTGVGAGLTDLTVNNTADRFYVNGTALDQNAATQANTWLAALGLNGLGTPHTQYSGTLLSVDPTAGVPTIQNGLTVQEMLLTPVPAPEPTTVLAGMLLLLPFGVSTVRFARKNSAV